MKKLKNLILICMVSITLLLLPNTSNATAEQILDYKSEIEIKKDSTMIVEETITVYSTGDEIKRGIYRDFPTQYKDKHGNKYNVGFEILSIKRDGKNEDYHTEKMKNGIRIYIGNSNTYLSPGYYTYTIKYQTNRQIGYFEDHDELYWNVTGNGWVFDIQNATAIVHLPEKTDMNEVEYEAYTGKQGETKKNYTASVNKRNNTVTFNITNTLKSNEGLTIVVEFEKGIVHEPTFEEKLQYFLSDNKGVLIGGIRINNIINILFLYMV